MRHAVLFLVFGSCLVLSGCVPVDSLHPLFAPGEAIFESSLEGGWKIVTEENSEESGMMTISRKDPSNLQSRDYSVRFSDGKEAMEFLGRLGRIDDELYLDLSPAVELYGAGVHTLQGIYAEPAFEEEHQVIKLNGDLLLEAEAVKWDGGGNGNIRQLRINVSPTHWLIKVELTDKELRLGYLDDEYVSRLIKNKDLEIDFVEKDGFVLTAMTSQLQQLVAQVANDPNAFTWLEYEKVENQ
jgi:hypothetical protein